MSVFTREIRMRTLLLFPNVKMIPSGNSDNAPILILFHLSITEPGDFFPVSSGLHQTIHRFGPASFHGKFLQKKGSHKEKDRKDLSIDLHRIFARDFDHVLEQNRKSRSSKNSFRIRSGRHKNCLLDAVPIELALCLSAGRDGTDPKQAVRGGGIPS